MAFHAAREVLDLLPIRPELENAITTTCLGRAVLVVELLEQVGHERLLQDPPGGGAGWARQLARLQTQDWFAEESTRRDRYLPDECSLPLPGAHKDWCDSIRDLRPRDWSWTEWLAAGGPTSTEHLIAAAQGVFQETKALNAFNRRHSWEPPRAIVLSFQVRCGASGCSHLACASDPLRVGNDTPAKRLREATPRSRHQDWLGARWRFAGHLQQELQLRTAMNSFAASWTNYTSAWRAWGIFVSSYHPWSPHFPITAARTAAFAAHFDNKGTVRTYISAIQKAQLLVGKGKPSDIHDFACVLRGIKAGVSTSPKCILTAPSSKKLILQALLNNLVHLARVMAVSYHFTLRAQSEAFGLRVGSPGPQLPGWHSYIKFVTKRGILNEVVISLERRKCHPRGSLVKRFCRCGRNPSLLCGPCALSAAAREAASQGRPADAPLFSIGSIENARKTLIGLAAACGLGKASWHGFRRGSASDLVASGSSLAQVLEAGGWRSAAFISYLSAHASAEGTGLEFAFLDSDSDHD